MRTGKENHTTQPHKVPYVLLEPINECGFDTQDFHTSTVSAYPMGLSHFHSSRITTLSAAASSDPSPDKQSDTTFGNHRTAPSRQCLHVCTTQQITKNSQTQDVELGND